jgi:hypothetical protein
MGLAKNFSLGFLSLLLILSLSLLVMSLAFNLTITEQSLNKIVHDNLEPFIDDQIDQTFADFTPQRTESEHRQALSVCLTSEVYEIGSQDNNVIYMDCNKVRNSTPDQFLQEMKNTLKSYVMDAVKESLDESTSKLKYVSFVLWVSIVSSVVIITLMILISWGFPFKSLGLSGIIAGSPFLILLILKPIVSKKIQQEIQTTLPPEILEQLSQSTIIEGVTDLISDLFFIIILGFAVLFFIGLTLLIIGMLIKKKKPQLQQPLQQFQQPVQRFVQPIQSPRQIVIFKNPR